MSAMRVAARAHKAHHLPGTPFEAALTSWQTLTRLEREHCAAAFPALDRYAGRVAAKQALLDVLGPAAASDVTVVRTATGAPAVCLEGEIATRAPAEVAVTIAHRRGHALAAAIAAPRPGIRVGVDLVERQAGRDPRVAARLGAPGELAELAPASLIALKEAAGKVLKRWWPDVSWLDVRCRSADEPPEAAVALATAVAAALGAGATRFVAIDPARRDAPIPELSLWGASTTTPTHVAACVLAAEIVDE